MPHETITIDTDQFAVVPRKMVIEADGIENLLFHADSGDEADPHNAVILWVGDIIDDNRKPTYGLHVASDECPEEGSLTLLDFPAPQTASFQNRVNSWMHKCFDEHTCTDTMERNHRFLEESLELVQSLGCTPSEAHQLVDYVFARPVGQPGQEVGGVRVTLAALCTAAAIQEDAEAERELARINAPEMIAMIRVKHAAKPKHSPLPEQAQQSDDRDTLLYLMQQFDSEEWSCERCGFSEPTSICDSADYLRNYLSGKQPAPRPGPTSEQFNEVLFALHECVLDWDDELDSERQIDFIGRARKLIEQHGNSLQQPGAIPL
jgi:hypothetical protein